MVDENIKNGLAKVHQMNLSDMVLIEPILASCKNSIQAFFKEQCFENSDPDHNQSYNIKNKKKSILNSL